MSTSSESSEAFFSGFDEKKKKRKTNKKKKKKGTPSHESEEDIELKDQIAKHIAVCISKAMEGLNVEVAKQIAEGVSKSIQRPEAIKMITDATFKSFKKSLNEELNPIKEQITALNEARKKDEDSLSTTQSQVQDLKNQVTELKKELYGVKTTSKKQEIVQQQAQSGRQNNIVLSGIAEDENENNEITHDKFNKLIEKMGCHVSSFSTRRLGRKRDDDKPRFILVAFDNFWDKRKVIATRMSLRDNGYENVFINEDLTKDQATLFYKARLAKKDQPKIKSTYTENGVVYIRIDGRPNPQPIINLEDLHSITSSLEATSS